MMSTSYVQSTSASAIASCLATLLMSACATQSYFIPPQPDLTHSPVIAVSPERNCSAGELRFRPNAELVRAINEGGSAGRSSLPLIEAETIPHRRHRRASIAAGVGASVISTGLVFIGDGLFNANDSFNEGRQKISTGLVTFVAGSLTTVVAGGFAIVNSPPGERAFEPLPHGSPSPWVHTRIADVCQAFTPEQWERAQYEKPGE